MHLKSIRKSIRQLVILLCAIVLLTGALYAAAWLTNRSRIRQQTEEYARLYTPAESTCTPTSSPTQSAAPSPEPTASAEPEPGLPAVVDRPRATPDGDTIVLSLPTPPPVQESFAELQALNPETVAFLTIDDVITLPVVQRENDNSYYLTHTFEQAESSEGTLFLDGMNRLSPEDDCLIVYGHNMHNVTMFGALDRYAERSFLEAHPIAAFDTIYENRTYVPIAAFPASMNPDSPDYFEVRQFLFDPQTFDWFISRLKAKSLFDIPVDAVYGDRILLLVTCDYTKDDGRFILALRQLRDGETAEEMRALISPDA